MLKDVEDDYVINFPNIANFTFQRTVPYSTTVKSHIRKPKTATTIFI